MRGRLTEWETAKVAHDILQVLCECHRQNICYADIKPANFLLKEALPPHKHVENAPQVKVADFGCSQRVLQVRAITVASVAKDTVMVACVLAGIILNERRVL